MADDQEQFHSLLEGLMSPDNNVRTAFETTYEAIAPQPKITFLIQASRNPDRSVESRTLAAVLIRRLFSASFEEVWPQITEDFQTAVKEQLLLAVKEESTIPVRRKMCDVVGELARNLIDDDGNMTWPEALKLMFEWASSEDPGLKGSALHIFGAVPGIFGNQQARYLDVIKQMLAQSLQDRNNSQIRYEATEATTSFLLAFEKEPNVLAHFRDLIPSVLEIVAESIAAQEDDTLLKNLISLAENVPKFLRSQLESIIGLCMKTVSDANLDDQWRQLALEVIVTLSETASAMVRKFGKFIPLLVPQVLALMVDLEDEPDWALQDEIEEEDGDSNAISGESALDRLACGLGGKTILPHILANIPQMLVNTDWRYRHAALMAISSCGEGCHAQMEQMLGNIVEAVLPYIKDPHPRVRYAACNALGQLSTDFGPIFQKKFHDKQFAVAFLGSMLKSRLSEQILPDLTSKMLAVLTVCSARGAFQVVPNLLLIMDDTDHPRVQAHGAAALVNFSEECPKSILAIYLDVIINKLEQVLNAKFEELLKKGTKMVLEQVVTTLASVADTVEEKFIDYYDRFMPCLKYIMQNAVDKELKLLRGKTIECISLIGLAVGKDKFMQDCTEVMQLLVKTQTDQQELAEDDPQVSYMISAWARMCKILGSEFQQYLPLVMGPVLRAASIKPEVTMVDSEDMKTLENDADWQFVTLGEQQSFGIRTAGLEEKATACQMLVCYARELKEAFSEYAEEVVNIMVPLLKFYFHDDVRISAAESLPHLLECAKIKGDQYVVDMWSYMCPHLLKALEIEPEQNVLPEHLNSLSKCIETLGKGCLSEEHMAMAVQNLDKILKDHFERQLKRQEQRKDEDYDDVVEESLLEEDDEDTYILSKVADVMHSLFGTHKETFLPTFEILMPHFVKLLDPSRPWPDRQWGLCIWDDVLEHTGPNSVKYQEYFLPSLMEYICDKQGEVRQAAAYGIGVMAQFGGESYAQACAQSISLLYRVVQDPESRSVENVNPTENVISAITKICKYNRSLVDVDKIIPDWLSWLPVTEDDDEAVHIYNFLCDLIEMNHPSVLGDSNQNLPRILSIVGEVFHRESVEKDSDIYKRLLVIVNQVKHNADLFQQCLNQITEEQQAALTSAIMCSE